jgi:hypothetical protein
VRCRKHSLCFGLLSFSLEYTNVFLPAFYRPALTYNVTHMAPSSDSPPLADADSWAVDQAVSLPEVWALVAACRGLVGAWRLLGVCRAARAGAKEFLRTLPRLVVCGGHEENIYGEPQSEVWGLNLATTRWEAMPALLSARCGPACCAVRGAVVVLGDLIPGGGITRGLAPTSRVEMLSKGGGAFVELPPLSCGPIIGAVAIAVDETHSALGQVLLLGGEQDQDNTSTSSVQLVDLATGICTPQADLLHARSYFAAARLLDGSIACAGGSGTLSTGEMWGRPVQGALDAAWTWRGLPAMSVGRSGCSGCVLGDGRFAVLGGISNSACTSSCEALTLGDDEHWVPLPPMHDARGYFACAAAAGCVIVAGGYPRRKSAEVFDEVLGRWLRLPNDFPHDSGLHQTGSALL